ncbi:MAG: type II toxin-antitoxin system PemK/MazF family toxin [Balneolaceae bacterium]
MITYKKWDIILVPFPFTNLKSVKRRPALVISPEKYNAGPDLIIMFITSNLSSFGKPGDHKIVEWNKSGLPKPSMVRMKFATIEKSIIVKTIGKVLKTDQLEVNKKLAEFFR